MAYEYKWAQNQQKLARAILEVGDVTKEEEIKKVYIRMAGQVIDVEEAPKKEVKEKPAKAPKKDVK